MGTTVTADMNMNMIMTVTAAADITTNRKEKMMEKLKRSKLISYAFIALGTLLCVFALNAFLVPHKLSMGGYTGLASVFYYVFYMNKSVINWKVFLQFFNQTITFIKIFT